MAQASKKCGQYSSEYLHFGFAVMPGTEHLPVCLLCERVFLNESMKPSRLKRHLIRRHPNMSNKDVSYYRALREKVVTGISAVLAAERNPGVVPCVWDVYRYGPSDEETQSAANSQTRRPASASYLDRAQHSTGEFDCIYDISIEKENLLNDKSSLRTYIHDVCDSLNCVDVLAVFVHAPAVHTAHGLSLLLGDAEEEEIYNLLELLDDLADCQAKQVYLILDHSYSGAAVEALASSTRHNNVIAVSSAKAYQSSWKGEFTRAFLEKSEVHDCFEDSFQVLYLWMVSITEHLSLCQLAKGLTRHSEPTIRYPGNWKNDKTMAGAPCHNSLFYNEKSVSENYVGCQNVPTAVWFSGRNPARSSKLHDSIGKQSTARSKQTFIVEHDQHNEHLS
ncbi:hypothetical protein TTRE_0000797801 [Trichuris trichiura]|uniref:BED-type domain-containing protein n=1 Tax=Trichuris trichiura TaxID=36087 RepID=A0A077ZM11_TRITR|nr:hypothetical protein TTRE_0000797801 [Trichuris trichiura]